MSLQELVKHTVQDLLHDRDENSLELVDGQFAELKIGQESSWIAGQIFLFLSLAVREANLGWVFPEGTGFELRGTGDVSVRKPDTSFILKSRFPNGPAKQGYGKVLPDLVVEVVSPNDLAYEVNDKVQKWLESGVRFVWVVWPSTKTVVVHTADADPHVLHAEDELTIDELIPDLKCNVKDLFPQAQA